MLECIANGRGHSARKPPLPPRIPESDPTNSVALETVWTRGMKTPVSVVSQLSVVSAVVIEPSCEQVKN